VYRENVLLTFLGILAGVVLGIFLHRYVILTVEVDMLMFGREIFPPSYLYSVLLTIFFSVVVNFGMFFKLRRIDMVESLKSAE
jgi:putative ABC transport system permease protein